MSHAQWIIFVIFVLGFLLSFIWWIGCPKYSQFDKRFKANLLDAEKSLDSDIERIESVEKSPERSRACYCFQKGCNLHGIHCSGRH